MKSTASLYSHHLWFERGGHRFAVSMSHLQEVLPMPALRPLPVVEPALSGLMILRQEVLPVFDPASLVSSQPVPDTTASVVIVLGLAGQPPMGLLAEKVGKVVELPPPVALTTNTRLPSAFTGEASISGGPRLLIVDAGTLAATMGLAQAVPAND